MNLYLISQSINNGYDTYDSAVVAAESKDKARCIHPSEYSPMTWDGENWRYENGNTPYTGMYGDWTTPDQLQAEMNK